MEANQYQVRLVPNGIRVSLCAISKTIVRADLTATLPWYFLYKEGADQALAEYVQELHYRAGPAGEDPLQLRIF